MVAADPDQDQEVAVPFLSLLFQRPHQARQRDAAGAVFSALASCLMPEAFTGEGDFEDYLQQFTTAATISGWQTATTDNRPNYFALGLKGNVLHFYTTLTKAQQQNFDQLVAALRTTYTTKVEVLKAKLKAARPQPNQTIATFFCDIGLLARRVYRGQHLIEEQMVLTSFIEGVHDAQLRWELRKNRLASPEACCSGPRSRTACFHGNGSQSYKWISGCSKHGFIHSTSTIDDNSIHLTRLYDGNINTNNPTKNSKSITTNKSKLCEFTFK